ncbi:unnamed protein product, partial [Prorocentrum cordatum]
RRSAAVRRGLARRGLGPGGGGGAGRLSLVGARGGSGRGGLPKVAGCATVTARA